MCAVGVLGVESCNASCVAITVYSILIEYLAILDSPNVTLHISFFAGIRNKEKEIEKNVSNIILFTPMLFMFYVKRDLIQVIFFSSTTSEKLSVKSI